MSLGDREAYSSRMLRAKEWEQPVASESKFVRFLGLAALKSTTKRVTGDGAGGERSKGLEDAPCSLGSVIERRLRRDERESSIESSSDIIADALVVERRYTMKKTAREGLTQCKEEVDVQHWQDGRAEDGGRCHVTPGELIVETGGGRCSRGLGKIFVSSVARTPTEGIDNWEETEEVVRGVGRRENGVERDN